MKYFGGVVCLTGNYWLDFGNGRDHDRIQECLKGTFIIAG